VPRKRWREESQPERASGRRSRSDASEGCLALALVPMFILGGIGALLALVVVMLGIDLLAGWMVRLIEPLMGPPALAVFGAALILFAAWGVLRMATGHAAPGTSGRDMIIAVIVMIGLAALGLGFLLAAFASRAPDTPGF
jgi:hypothetical protein